MSKRTSGKKIILCITVQKSLHMYQYIYREREILTESKKRGFEKCEGEVLQMKKRKKKRRREKQRGGSRLFIVRLQTERLRVGFIPISYQKRKDLTCYTRAFFYFFFELKKNHSFFLFFLKRKLL